MRRHLFWIIEALCWLTLLIIIAGGIVFFNYGHSKDDNIYQLLLPDVDGLIIGSPVKFMGIQVGYIKEIKLYEDKVLLKFIITEKGIQLPLNTVATVEFYGLGGSKSLELYPPENNELKTNDIIIAQPPKKIRDSLSLLYRMFDDISEITFALSRFVYKMDGIEKDVNFLKDSGEDLKNRANIMLKNESNEQIEKE